MKRVTKIFSLIGFLTLTLTIVIGYANCSAKHTEGQSSASGINSTEVLQSLQANSLSILNSKCASCHNAATTNSNLKNILDPTYLTVSGYVDVGSPQTSILYLKIVDKIMPPAGSPGVTEDELGILRDWIAALGGNFDTYIGSVDGAPSTGSGGPAGTFTQVLTILQQRCLSCHSGGQSPPNLNVPYAQLLTIKTAAGLDLVVPGNASNSGLYQVVVNNFMPQGNPLTNSQKEIIRSWITSGAPNN